MYALFAKLKKKEKILQVNAYLIIASFDWLRFSGSYFYDNVVKGNDLKNVFKKCDIIFNWVWSVSLLKIFILEKRWITCPFFVWDNNDKEI